MMKHIITDSVERRLKSNKSVFWSQGQSTGEVKSRWQSMRDAEVLKVRVWQRVKTSRPGTAGDALSCLMPV